MASSCADRVFTSKVAARIVPAAIIGILTYATWAMVTQVVVNSFLSTAPRQDGMAIGFLVVYFFFLFMTLVCYFRLLFLTATNPGYVPLLNGDDHPDEPNDLDLERLCNYAQREIFVCNDDGKPVYCEWCHGWKPERAHHSADVNRCVEKMDHFCPWVGGMVSSTTYKFFVQFNFYTGLLCFFLLGCTAYVTSITAPVNPHLIALLILGAFFGLFAGGMAVKCLVATWHNWTDVELEILWSHIYTLAVHLPHGITPELKEVPGLRFVTYPLIPVRTIPPRAFALIKLPAGTNPFDLGWRRNLRSVFGDTALDWFLPIRLSPCVLERQAEWAEPPYGAALCEAVKKAGLTV